MAIQERPRGDLRCPKCEVRIESDHPYSWCIKCGTPLPADVQAQLAKLREVKTAAAEAVAAPRKGKPDRTTELVVEGRVIPCPICGHDRFRTRKTVMASAGLAIFDMEWAGTEAINYVCHRCGHVLWFIR
jgi:DNA-directed RNA polymerase subunit RPC12/RpoP